MELEVNISIKVANLRQFAFVNAHFKHARDGGSPEVLVVAGHEESYRIEQLPKLPREETLYLEVVLWPF